MIVKIHKFQLPINQSLVMQGINHSQLKSCHQILAKALTIMIM